MSTESNDTGKTLHEKFPDMQPIGRPPSMVCINGIGTRVYGRRDADQETGTYIKTLCFCVLFIPLIPLAAYRVADATSGGWYFLGKERLSSFAKYWNLALLVLALVGGAAIGWQQHTSSPAYIAQRDLSRAEHDYKTGHALEAARTYLRVAESGYLVEDARAGLKKALDQCLANDNANVVAQGLNIIVKLPKRLNEPAPLMPDTLQRGLELVTHFRQRDPSAALEILKTIDPLDLKHTQTKPVRFSLLQEIVATKPDNVDFAVELALAYEADEQVTNAVKVLAPHRAKLGATEGARIFGQHLLSEGKNEESYTLLYPYVQSRLQKLQSIEAAYTNAIAQSSRRAIEHLNHEKADKSFYEKYQQASKAEQAAMVDEFMENWMRTDAQVIRAQENLREANQIVHVTLDLGIVQLGRAQAQQDPAARKAELEAAEKTFLAIRSFAGNTDEYRMFLGQVYYWLGRSQEGRKLFDELLAARKRSPGLLLSLSQTLRHVGEYQQARELCEEAYNKTTDAKEKFRAASLRAHVQKDLDDEIAWLEKCDPDDHFTQVELSNARGQHQLEKGDRSGAMNYFRKAIAGYDSLPRSSPTLNNQGLACLNLYEVSGDLNDHTRGLKLLEEAIALDPGNSILLHNTAHCLVGRAYLDVVKDSLRLDLLKEDPDSSMLAHLYRDEASRAEIYQRLRENEHMKKALNYYDKALLLAPKSLGLYVSISHLQSEFRDLAELQKLQQRAKAAALDPSNDRKDWQLHYSGAKDKEQLARMQASLVKTEALLNSPEIQQHPLTLERVKSRIIGTRQALAMFGAAVDADAQLALARELQSPQPTGVASYTLISALMFKAHSDLKSRDANYAALAQKTRLSLSPQELITLALERGGATATSIRVNPQVREAVNLIIAANQRFPAYPQASEWALVREFDKTAAADIASRCKASPLARANDDLEFQLRPLRGSAVLDEHWDFELEGDNTKAVAVLTEAAARGVPLP